MEHRKKDTRSLDEPIEAHRETSGLSDEQRVVIKRFVTSRLKGMSRPLDCSVKRASQKLWDDLSNPEGKFFPGCSMDIQGLFAKHMMNAENLAALDRASLRTIIASGRCPIRRERMVLRVSLGSANSNFSTLMMFLRNSSKHLQDIQHNLIIQCFGNSETPRGGTIYFEHALVNTIAHLLLERGPDTSTRLVDEVIFQVLEGLDYLHSRERMVHNAINCDTICLDTLGVVKIAGFGLSHRVSDLETAFPDNLASYIEAGYETFWLAPEVLNQRHCSYLADVWSVGCLMAEMCTGERPMSLSEEVDEQDKPKEMRTVLDLIHVVQEPHKTLLSKMVKKDAGKRLTVPILVGEFEHEVTPTRETFSKGMSSGRVAANTSGFYVWSCIGPRLARRVPRNTAAERYRDS